MNKHLKNFFLRGLIFGGFGPIILGVVYLCISLSVEDFSPSGKEIFIGIISTYVLAFIHAGASVFNQIEHWPIAKSLLFHFGSLYLAYTGCYIINAWIPFEPLVLIIFTLSFIFLYFLVWLIVFLSVRAASRMMNKKLLEKENG